MCAVLMSSKAQSVNRSAARESAFRFDPNRRSPTDPPKETEHDNNSKNLDNLRGYSNCTRPTCSCFSCSSCACATHKCDCYIVNHHRHNGYKCIGNHHFCHYRNWSRWNRS